jgi:SAM-dependent methyltransferase
MRLKSSATAKDAALHCASGWGPGKQTEDGCSVELYRALPYLGELKEVIGLFPPGSTLELGCGTGRLCEQLRDRGLDATGVDHSEDMLSFVPAGIRRVLGDIETLQLECAFNSVLLASHLINHENESVAKAFLATAARHVTPNGLVFVQRFDPDWLMNTSEGFTAGIQGIKLTVERVEVQGSSVSMTLRYERDCDVWFHAFSARVLDEVSTEKMLAGAGFVHPKWYGARRTWVVARRG